MNTDAGRAALLLHAWLSPAFPIGAYSYSHGLEFAVECGLVHDAGTLREWAATILRAGAARSDGVLLLAACRAVAHDDEEQLLALAELASALRPTAEFALESGQQGSSFLSTVRAAWPHPRLNETAALLARRGLEPALPIAVGIAAAVHRIPPELLLAPYLQAFTANIVSAGARLVPLGQTECQRVIGELQPLLPDLGEEILSTDADDVGGCVPVVEWCSMRHETQYTRLFRS